MPDREDPKYAVLEQRVTALEADVQKVVTSHAMTRQDVRVLTELFQLADDALDSNTNELKELRQGLQASQIEVLGKLTDFESRSRESGERLREEVQTTTRHALVFVITVLLAAVGGLFMYILSLLV